MNDRDLVKPMVLDMPLLTDPEKFFNTNDDSNNNNKNPRDCHHFDNGFIETSNKYQTEAADVPANLCLESQYHHDLNRVIINYTHHSEESLTNSDAPVSDDDISEFLIFHKKSPMECDPKLKNGCHVQLKRIEIPETKKPVTNPSKRVTRSQSSIFVSTAPKRKSKKAKHIQPRALKDSNGSSRPIDDLKSNLSCDAFERPKIVLKIVRKNQANRKKSVYQCFDLCQLNNRSAIKECSVVIEPLQILNPVSMKPFFFCPNSLSCGIQINPILRTESFAKMSQ